MENKKVVTIVGAIIIIIVIVTVIYFIQMAKSPSAPTPAPTPAPVTTQPEKTKATPVSTTGVETISGTVMAISEKDVKLDVGAAEPEFVGISVSTPVVKLKSDQKEALSGLFDVSSGVKVKIDYKTDAETKLKVAEKIYVLEK
jgi:hypothetical protein